MSTNHTPNYQLCQWERTDKVMMEDFNADNAKIDAAIKAVDVKTSGKADASALSSLSQTVTGLTTTLNKKGNCRVELKSYTGTGTFGSDNPNMIYFTRKPLMVIFMSPGDGGFVIAFRDVTAAQYSNGYSVTVRWSGNSVGLWNGRSAGLQLNTEGANYYILGLLPADE
ncbi:hypothetical protein AALA83_16405 [Oscillospiraceae bacterium 44-5]